MWVETPTGIVRTDHGYLQELELQTRWLNRIVIVVERHEI
jgi:hypothetical protein